MDARAVRAFIAFFSLAWHVALHAAGGPDLGQIWFAARELVAGRDPYLATGPGRAFEWEATLYYPLPAILLVVPLSWLTLQGATAVFSGLGAALLGFAITRENWVRLPLFLSAAALLAAIRGQWSFVIAAAALTPGIGFVLAAKPTIGAGAFTYHPSRRAVVGCAILIALAFLVRPGWVPEWIRSVTSATPSYVPSVGPRGTAGAVIPYFAPISRFGGVLLLLAALRWKRPEARYLLALSLIPQTM